MSKKAEINKDSVLKFLTLSRLDPSSENLDKLVNELKSILNVVEELFKTDVKDVKPMSHMNAVESVFREDVCEEHTPIKEFLKNAPDSTGTFFRVPLVIE